jgi:hypothetical protein
LRNPSMYVERHAMTLAAPWLFPEGWWRARAVV